MARTERSAGVVAYVDHPPLFLLLDYGRHWDYAKGHVKRGEDDLTAARRELEEETGIARAEIDPEFSHEITYFFRYPKRGLIRKTVIFFLARLDTRDVTLSEEHVGYDFLPYESALQRLTYPSAREVLEKAHAHLLKRPPAAT